MGIRNLNKYLLQNCTNSIQNIHLSIFSGKKISVDISIYLYNFERQKNLINGITNMIQTLKYYGIIPIFIFDGKPPNEKKYILQERKQIKEKNKQKIKELNEILLDTNILHEEKQTISSTIEKLERQTVQITKEKIEQVKHIMRTHGVTYYDAPQEADELCCILATREQVWACMSEDMDMFIYGCPRIIRYINIYNSSATIYDLNYILYELNISFNNFKQICILSGTDYNSQNNKYNLSSSIQLFNQYQEFLQIHSYHKLYSPLGFIEWIIEHIDATLNYELLHKIYYMFDLNCPNKLSQFRNILIINNNY
jgi:flap endonuclease-1